MQLGWKRPKMRIVVLAWMIIGVSSQIDAADAHSLDFAVHPLERISPGTVVLEKGASGWSDLILLAHGSVGMGDVQAASASVRKYTSLFDLVFMANVLRHPNGDYELEKVGVGFATVIEGTPTVISSDTYRRLGADLDFLDGQVFAATERDLVHVVQVAKYRDGVLFDVPTIMLIGGEHRKLLIRYFVWVSPQGTVGTVCWLLDGYRDGNYRMLSDEVVFLRSHLHENRVLHVDARRFTLGIPADDAFAVVSLPPGRKYTVDGSLQRLMSQPRYTSHSFFATVSQLSQRLTSGQ